MRRFPAPHTADVVMLGTFAAWRLGTLQARALPIAQELRRRGLRVSIVTTPWDLPAERGVREQIAGVQVLNTQHVGMLSAPWAIREQLAELRRMSPRLVHLFKPRGFGGITARLLPAGLPLVVDSDDWEGDGGWNRIGSYTPLQRRVFDWQERDMIRRASIVTAASTLLEERARRLRADKAPGSVVFVPNGLTIHRISRLAPSHGRSLLTEGSGHRIVIYSRFEEFPHDWLDRFVGALADLVDHVTHLILIGPREAEVRGVGSVDVELMGYVSYEQIPDLLQSASLAVVPLEDSLVGRSKQSVKLLELMAAGVPIVAADVGDARQTVGEAGVMVAGSCPLRFARAVSALLNNPAQRTAMSTAGPLRVRNHFTIEHVVNQVAPAYERCGLTL